MRVKLTAHAKAQMKNRGIGKSLVYQTVINPDAVSFDKRGGKLLSKSFGNEVLLAPIKETGNDIIVKSVFFKRK